MIFNILINELLYKPNYASFCTSTSLPTKKQEHVIHFDIMKWTCVHSKPDSMHLIFGGNDKRTQAEVTSTDIGLGKTKVQRHLGLKKRSLKKLPYVLS